jgi:hypothetical protein
MGGRANPLQDAAANVQGSNFVRGGARRTNGTCTSQVERAQTCLVTPGEGVPTGAVGRRAA